MTFDDSHENTHYFGWFWRVATKTPLNLPRVAHALAALVSMFFPSPAGLSEWLMAFTDDCQVEDCSPDHFAQRTFILRSRWAITRQLETQFMKVRALVQHGKLSGSGIAVVLVRAAWLLELGSKCIQCQLTCRWYCRIEHGGTINVGPCPLCFLLVIFSRSARNQRSPDFWDLHNEIQIAAKREATPVHGHFKKGRLWFSISHRMFYCAYSCLFYFLLVYYYMLVSNEFPQPSSRTSWTRQQQ